MASSDREVRARLQQYVLGEQDLPAFQRWFTPVIWREDRSASNLMRAVELYLAEYTSGHRSEPELRSLFADLLEGTQSPDRSEPELEPWTPDSPTFHVDEESLSVNA